MNLLAEYITQLPKEAYLTERCMRISRVWWCVRRPGGSWIAVKTKFAARQWLRQNYLGERYPGGGGYSLTGQDIDNFMNGL